MARRPARTDRVKVLIVDDEAGIRALLRDTLADEGFVTLEAATAGDALRALREPGRCDIVIVDVRLPDRGGLDLLADLGNLGIDIPAIMMTAYSTTSLAIEAMKLGAFDYVVKPFDLQEMVAVVRKAAEVSALKGEVAYLRSELDRVSGFSDEALVGQSPAMQAVYKLIGKVAATDSTVLISGESGTGKELVAGALHRNSHRAAGPFVKLNCAAVPEGLLESELFGHERGAFTGASVCRKGKFEQACGGTLLLDEIGEMSLGLQAKILRALQEREIERLGGGEPIPVDVRVIACTNQNLEEAIRLGRFRQDLYYRLNVVAIHLPPLRERKEDIPLLCRHFLEKANRKARRHVEGFSKEAVNALAAYDWPGNIRELENAIERAVLLARGPVISHCDLMDSITARDKNDVRACEGNASQKPGSSKASTRLKDVLATVEREMILSALRETAWRSGKAADLLGINRRSLYEKMKRHGIGRPFRQGGRGASFSATRPRPGAEPSDPGARRENGEG